MTVSLLSCNRGTTGFSFTGISASPLSTILVAFSSSSSCSETERNFGMLISPLLEGATLLVFFFRHMPAILAFSGLRGPEFRKSARCWIAATGDTACCGADVFITRSSELRHRDRCCAENTPPILSFSRLNLLKISLIFTRFSYEKAVIDLLCLVVAGANFYAKRAIGENASGSRDRAKDRSRLYYCCGGEKLVLGSSSE